MKRDRGYTGPEQPSAPRGGPYQAQQPPYPMQAPHLPAQALPQMTPQYQQQLMNQLVHQLQAPGAPGAPGAAGAAGGYFGQHPPRAPMQPNYNPAAAGAPGAPVADPSATPNLFVFHIPTNVNESELHRLFAPFGPLNSVKVMMDPRTGASKGFGFVEYTNITSASAAVKAMNGFPLQNKYLKVQFKAEKRRPIVSHQRDEREGSGYEVSQAPTSYQFCFKSSEGDLDVLKAAVFGAGGGTTTTGKTQVAFTTAVGEYQFVPAGDTELKKSTVYQVEIKCPAEKMKSILSAFKQAQSEPLPYHIQALTDETQLPTP